MQMRNCYETTNKPARISALKAAAVECEAKGFPAFTALNTEMAGLLQAEIDAVTKAARKAAYANERDTDPDFTAPTL
jgi:hypothetical protein